MGRSQAAALFISALMITALAASCDNLSNFIGNKGSGNKNAGLDGTMAVPSGTESLELTFPEALSKIAELNETAAEGETASIAIRLTTGLSDEGFVLLRDALIDAPRTELYLDLSDLATLEAIPTHAFYRSESNSELENTQAASVPNLKGISLPQGLRSIGESAFMETGISTIVLPRSLRSIGKTAFFNTNLTAVTIPANVNEIGYGAFYSSKVKEVKLLATHPPRALDTRGNTTDSPINSDNWEAFHNTPLAADGRIIVPKTTADIYMKAPGWVYYKGLIQEEETAQF